MEEAEGFHEDVTGVTFQAPSTTRLQSILPKSAKVICYGQYSLGDRISRKLAPWSLREFLFTNIVSWAMEKSGTTWSDTSEI